jgi:hypothetical protein
MATLRTGKPQNNVPAHLDTYENGEPVVKKISISTERHGPVVRMMIEEVS